MDETRAREVASWWHGGQSSALYAFSSSGYVGGGLAGEIRQCQAEVKAHVGNYTQDDIRQLRLLAEYVDSREAMHSTYPHDPGYLHNCPACEAKCFCTPGNMECVYEGEHNGTGERWED